MSVNSKFYKLAFIRFIGSNLHLNNSMTFGCPYRQNKLRIFVQQLALFSTRYVTTVATVKVYLLLQDDIKLQLKQLFAAN